MIPDPKDPVGATSDNSIVRFVGMTVGGLMMGKGISGAFGKDQLFLEGATRGFTQTVLSGGDIGQIFTNTMTGGLNAQITNQLPDAFGLHHDQFSLGLDIGHGVVQGTFTALRGGKFKTGFISGMASKGISAIMRGTSLSQADPFVKMTITSVLSGMASKASGGDFVQGAMSAMVVWLYNEAGDIFNTPDAAAREATSNAFGKAYDKKEWHGLIYRKDGGYSYTEPSNKGATKFNTTIYKRAHYNGGKVVGYYHIHTIKGRYGKHYYDPEHFSQADIDVLKGSIPLQYAYVGTLGGQVLKYTYNPKTVNNWQNNYVNVGTWRGVYSPSVSAPSNSGYTVVETVNQ